MMIYHVLVQDDAMEALLRWIRTQQLERRTICT